MQELVFMFDSLKLGDLPKRQCEILRRSSSTRPTIWRIEEKGVRAIVKDFSSNEFFFRNTLGRFLVWREAKAYQKLKNLKGVPALYRIIDGLAMVIQEIPGMDLGKAEKVKELPDGFFDELTKLVDGFHQRGLAHCDLKRAANLLIGDDGNPYVIDWAAAIFRNGYRISPFSLIYKRFVQDDYNAITKRKLCWSPELVTPEEKAIYDHRSGFERSIRAFRDKLREFLQKVA